MCIYRLAAGNLQARILLPARAASAAGGGQRALSLSIS